MRAAVTGGIVQVGVRASSGSASFSFNIVLFPANRVSMGVRSPAFLWGKLCLKFCGLWAVLSWASSPW
jgi:hypothetical protein